ncbi:uncharacterized protein [Henckelia pumila]|uniref:uncharacterized protein n=1 Tax=Henckelia pumila TaxID=405737 RepID=UPI003C6DDA23
MDDTSQEIVLVAPRVESNVVSTREAEFHVDFNFSCDMFVCEYYDDVLLGHSVRTSVMTKSVRMDIKRLMDPGSRRMINDELREWPLDADDHLGLREYAIAAAKILIRLMPPQHNVLVIPFTVLVMYNRQVRARDLAMELTVGRSMVEAGSGMVPATDSSIESLEIKTATLGMDVGMDVDVNVDEICSICLEDFGCEILSMPCSHIFHEDCIKKWLKSSHYCPICRFEMPTS